MNENHPHEEEEEDAVSSPFPSSPLFGRLRGTFTTPSKRSQQEGGSTQSYAMQGCWAVGLPLIAIIVFTISLVAMTSNAPVSDNNSQGLTEFSNPNLLGLYHVSMPLPGASLKESSSIAPELPVRPKLEEESFFLRYYVMPLEQVKKEPMEEGNSSSTETDENRTAVATTTRLMRPRSRLLQTARALKDELEITAKEDVLQPLLQRWTGRIEGVKRRLQTLPAISKEEVKEQEPGASIKLPLLPASNSRGVQTNSILGFYPSDLLANTTDPSLSRAFQTRLPQGLHKTKAQPSSCPSSLFCYYTLPPTIEQNGTVCKSYCRRCLETTAELKEAVQEYLQDPSHTSKVAKTYGWPIGNWCVSYIQDFSFLFASAIHFNEDLSNWDLSSATSVKSMFRNARVFNQPLGSWSTSNVQDMSFFLAGASRFNQPLNDWDISRVTTLQSTFMKATRFNQDLNRWNVRKVQDLSHAFDGATKFAGDVSTWTTASARNMQAVFRDAISFDGDLATWSFRGVTNLSFMFSGAASFLPVSLNDWDLTSATTMKGLFRGIHKFNANVSSWSTTKVADFSHAFEGCSKFNQDLSKWQVGSATDMQYMFAGCAAFNSPLPDWQIYRVANMTCMFMGATSFEQDLTNWKPYAVKENRESMFEGATQFERRYKDVIYAAWAKHASRNSLMFGEHQGDGQSKQKTLLHLWNQVRNNTLVADFLSNHTNQPATND